jgi:uncharacterized RDD family membrane protein YckC
MTDRRTKLVTPEAVVLDVEAAGIASRILAAILDIIAFEIVASSVLSAISALGLAIDPSGDSTIGVVMAVVLIFSGFALLVIWPVAWETLTRGRSIGKYALGIRVVTVQGAPIRFRHALIRSLVGLVELILMLGTLGLIVALSSRNFRRIGDHLAGTVVVRDRQSGGALAQAVRFTPHPWWDAWATQLDATRMTGEHYRLIRSYLLRARGLTPAVRNELGARIFGLVGANLGLSDAAVAQALGWGPVIPLTAVAAAYQRRFYGITAAAQPWMPFTMPPLAPGQPWPGYAAAPPAA